MSTEQGIPAVDLPPVRRRYVDANGSTVHYRVAGEGPAIVMLHDSPRSSRLHLHTMRALASEFRIYALDTPGYGNSQALASKDPTIRDFAEALGGAIDALGLSDAPIYATHTSAKIALEYAAMVSASTVRPVILDGLSIPTSPPNPAFIEAYMRPFVLDAAGGYLAAEWTRMRDMLRWFPWFDQRPASRMPIDQPDAEWIRDYVIDFFSAGPSYSSAYAAAMYYDPSAALLAARCPVLVAAKTDDVLYSSLDRVPLSDNQALSVQKLSADRGEWLQWLAGTLRSATQGANPASALPQQPDRGLMYADLPTGQVHVSRSDGKGTPLLILSAPTTLHARAWQDAMGERPVLVPDLPGFGESDAIENQGIDAFASVMASMLDELGAGRVDVLGSGYAAPIAAALAARHPDKVRKLVLDGAFEPHADEDALCPQFAFDGAGGHVHRYWHMLRDGEANWPWFVDDRHGQRALQPRLGERELHDALVGVLKQEARYGDAARAACRGDIASCYPQMPQPVLVFTHATDPGYRAADSVIAQLSGAQAAERPATIEEAARLVAAFLAADSASSDPQSPLVEASA